MGRVVVPPDAKGGPIVAVIRTAQPHPAHCWCQPPDVAHAALQKLQPMR